MHINLNSTDMFNIKRFLFSEGIECDEFLTDIELVEFPKGFIQ